MRNEMKDPIELRVRVPRNDMATMLRDFPEMDWYDRAVKHAAHELVHRAEQYIEWKKFDPRYDDIDAYAEGRLIIGRNIYSRVMHTKPHPWEWLPWAIEDILGWLFDREGGPQ